MNASKPKSYKLGIIGWPVAHSVSPTIHRAAANALDLELEYYLYPIEPTKFEDGISAIREQHLNGFNVTVPHKVRILDELDVIDPSALAIGAVNTVVVKNDRWHGYNTDAPGLVRSLEAEGVQLNNANVIVLGAGGAARAAIVGLLNAGARSVGVCARKIASAEELCSLGDNVHSLSWPLTPDAVTETGLLVQATSATLGDRDADRSFANALPLHHLPKHATVVDLVYKPLQTSVLSAAEDLGLQTVDGLGMLLHQGALAFELWTGREAPVETMRQALDATVS
ncbi:MAG: shikimate dehydrogenase [Polyangiales bacterium]